jgi:hypothetical protein
MRYDARPTHIIVGCIYLGIFLVNAALGIGIICVAIHFIKKLW